VLAAPALGSCCSRAWKEFFHPALSAAMRSARSSSSRRWPADQVALSVTVELSRRTLRGPETARF